MSKLRNIGSLLLLCMLSACATKSTLNVQHTEELVGKKIAIYVFSRDPNALYSVTKTVVEANGGTAIPADDWRQADYFIKVEPEIDTEAYSNTGLTNAGTGILSVLTLGVTKAFYKIDMLMNVSIYKVNSKERNLLKKYEDRHEVSCSISPYGDDSFEDKCKREINWENLYNERIPSIFEKAKEEYIFY